MNLNIQKFLIIDNGAGIFETLGNQNIWLSWKIISYFIVILKKCYEDIH